MSSGMKTNYEKYCHYLAQIEAKDAAELAALFPNGFPSKFFCVGQYSADVRHVTGIRKYRKGVFRPDPSTKITRSDVAAAIQALETWVAPSMDELSVYYTYSQKFGAASGAEKLSKINAGDGMAWTAEALEPEIRRRKELYEPREGHEPCAHCGKQNAPQDMVPGVVIYRMNGGVQRKTQMYCKDKLCASYDQMAHEG